MSPSSNIQKPIVKNKSRKITMLSGTLWNKILIFALPIALQGILQQLFNSADIAVVGRYTENPTYSIAAVGANAPIIGLIVNLFLGTALGANVVIAKAFGEKNLDTVEKAVHTSIVFSLIAGIFSLVIGELISEPILKLVKVPEAVMSLSLIYLRIYFLALPFILLFNFESAIFRAVGDTKTPLIILAASGVLNVGLNFFFVAGLDFGVKGVAIATVASNVFSSIVLFIILTKTKHHIKVSVRKLKIHKSVFISILKIGVPSGLQSAIFAFSNIIMSSAVNTLGTTIMAGSSVAYNVEIFAFYVMNSFGQACTTFVGQNYGAKQIDRCKRTLIICIVEALISLGICMVLLLSCGREILSIFNDDPEVIEIGYIRMFYILISYIFSLLYDNQAGYMRGFGISFTPAILTVSGVCGVRIFWRYVIFAHNPTFKILMIAYPISLFITATLMFIALVCFRPAKRKKELILEPADLC